MQNKNIQSNQSFDIISNTPTTNENNIKFPSSNNIVYNNSNDYDNLLDKEIEKYNDEQYIIFPPAPSNTPILNIKDNFDTKITQITEVIDQLESTQSNNKIKKNIKSLKKHLKKIQTDKKKGMKYEEFIMKMINAIKNDKQINKHLKNLYI